MSEYVVNRENVWPYGSQREEIVRCKDCAYMEQQTTYDGSMSWFLCTHFDRPTRRDGFCAWGVRK